MSHGKVCTCLALCMPQPGTSLWGFRDWLSYLRLTRYFGRVGTQQHTQDSEPQTTAVCILDVLDPVWKIRRKLWIIPTTKLRFLSVEVGCHPGSPDLKDHLHFTPDLVPALLSLPISSCLSPLNGAPDPEGYLPPYTLNSWSHKSRDLWRHGEKPFCKALPQRCRW